jgi:CDP-diacylglycerol---glycerol-3-phosphate 3-phosphatidyltransferase
LVRCVPTVIVLGAVVALAIHGPIPQFAHYHDFADRRAWSEIPNALDVLSNFGFALVGAYGIWRLWPRRNDPAIRAGSAGYGILLVSLVLTAMGSTFYHLDPDNGRLIWDRLPIALVCAGLLAGVRAQVVNATGERMAIALAMGAIASVLWWSLSGVEGTGDLRPYLLLQAAPLVLIPVWHAIYKAPRADRIAFATAIAFYLAAKACELFDHELFAVLHWVSGHSLKHLLASAAAAVIVVRLTHQTGSERAACTSMWYAEPGALPTSLAVNSLCPRRCGLPSGATDVGHGLEGGPWLSIYALKPKFQALLRPLTSALARSGVSANQVTLAAAVVSVALGGFVLFEAPTRLPFALIPVWMLVRMALNAIDGMLAREFAQKSNLGAYLNELGDVVSDSALYLPFAWLPPFAASSVALVIVLAILTELAGVLGTTIRASRRYDGPMGKADRAFVFGALGLWAGLGLPLPDWISWLMPAVAAALALTIVNRVRGGLAESGKAPSHE